MNIYDTVLSIIALVIIVIMLILLLNVVYRTCLVKIVLIKIISKPTTTDYIDTYYYNVIKKQKVIKKNVKFYSYIFIKRWQSRLAFYSKDKEKLVAKLRTPFVLSLIILILFTGISNIDLKIFIISCIIVLSTIVLFVVSYKSKYLKKDSNGESDV